MANPLNADQIISALRAEGVVVSEHRDWRTHNRNSVGPWGPVHGVMIHHTVTAGTTGSVELCYNGRSDLPGPLCHGVVDKRGVVHLVGNGRANHAGKGDGDVLSAVIAESPLPPDNETNTDGNTYFYGFECINLGDNADPWPQAQVEAVVRASAALCRAHGWGKDGDTSVIGHAEWQPGKIDPRGPGISMNDVRSRVAERLDHPANWNPGEDMPEHIIFERSTEFTLTAGDWWTPDWDRFYTRIGGWQDRPAGQTLITGPAYYTVSFGGQISGLQAGQEIQLRVARNARDAEGVWYRDYNRPISSPVHSEKELHFSHTWNGYHPGGNDTRLVVDLLVPQIVSGQSLTASGLVVEMLYWPS